ARDPQARELTGRVGRDETVVRPERPFAFGLLRERAGDDAHLAAPGRRPLHRRDQVAQIDPIAAAYLREQVPATDEIAGRADAESRGDERELFAERAEEPREVQDGALELARLEPLHAALGRLDRGLDLRGDADVTGVELATPADRAADRDHGERPESNAVRAKAEHLRDVERALHTAVAPDLDEAAKSRRHQSLMRLGDADLDRKPRSAKRVLARGAGTSVEPGERDDVRARFRDTDRDDADVGHDRDLDGDARARVHGLELVDDLGEILDGVDVVVVARRDEVDPGLRVARERHLLRHLARREVSAFAGLRALADL